MAVLLSSQNYLRTILKALPKRGLEARSGVGTLQKKNTEIRYNTKSGIVAVFTSEIQKWRETPKRLRHGGKKVKIGQTLIFPELQIGQKA